MMKTKRAAVIYAVLAALLYAINIPFSKVLLNMVQPAMMAALLYLGAGLGLAVYGLTAREKEPVEPIGKKQYPYVMGMILLDIAAPILLMLGLNSTGAANASLLNNFEIVATSLIAFLVFREKVSGKLALAIVLVLAASIILSLEGGESFRFHIGSVYVLGAAACWGMENNCTRMLSNCSSVRITTIKGIFSGIGSLIVAFIAREQLPQIGWLVVVMALGFVAYGLSINFYIKAQSVLGAAKTSAYYSVAPFMGVAFGMVMLGERPAWQFYAGLAILIVATALMVKDTFDTAEY